MTITQANYLIALRLIHAQSLSRFIQKANQTNHPLTNTHLILSLSLYSCHISPVGIVQDTVSCQRAAGGRSFAFKQRR